MLLRRAGGSLLRNPCPPSGPLEGWGPQVKRSGRDGAKRKVSGGRAAVRLAEGWTYAQRKSSRPPGGRANRRSAEEQPSVRRKSGRPLSGRAAVRLAEGWTYAQRENSRPPGGRVTNSAGKAAGWPDADQGADQDADQGADQSADQLVRAKNENRAALLVRPALIFGWLHLSQQMCVLKVVISSPHRTLHTSHI